MSKLSSCLAASMLLLACAGDGSATFGGGVGGTGGEAGTGGTAGVAGDAGTDAAVWRFDNLLRITVDQGITGHGTPFSETTVLLSNPEIAELPVVQKVDNCEVIDLRTFDGYAASTPTPGNIWIDDAREDDIVMAPLLINGPIRPQELYAYYAPSQEVPRWAAGDRLFIAADGAELPGFRAILPFPEQVQVRAVIHSEAENRLPTIYRDRDLRLFWSAIDQQVGVSVLQYRADGSGRLAYCVQCAFPGDVGFGRITAKVLAGLDDDDSLAGESRTEAYLSGMRLTRMQHADTVIEIMLTHGTGFMIDVQ